MSNPLFPTLETFTRTAEALSVGVGNGFATESTSIPVPIFLNPTYSFVTYNTPFFGVSGGFGTGYATDENPVEVLPQFLNPLFTQFVPVNGVSLGIATGGGYTNRLPRFSIGIASGGGVELEVSQLCIYLDSAATFEGDLAKVQPIYSNLIFQRSTSTLTYVSRVKFPEIEPSRRSFSSLNVAITSTMSQSGVVSKRAWGNKPSKADMRLTFENIADDEAAEILSVYNTANGSATEIYLPDLIFAGMSASLQSEWKDYLASAGMRWFFSDADPPSLESAFPGRSTMQVVMVAEQRRAPDEFGFNKVVFIGLVPGTATTS